MVTNQVRKLKRMGGYGSETDTDTESDSDYAGCIDTSRSTSGWNLFVKNNEDPEGGGLINWSSKLQIKPVTPTP